MSTDRSHWNRHVQDVLRSGHYTWLCEGLAGLPTDVAMTTLLTDIQHLCAMSDHSFDDLLEQSRSQFEHEEAQRPRRRTSEFARA